MIYLRILRLVGILVNWGILRWIDLLIRVEIYLRIMLGFLFFIGIIGFILLVRVVMVRVGFLIECFHLVFLMKVVRVFLIHIFVISKLRRLIICS